MERDYYTNINELIEDVNNLGDWRDKKETPKFLKVIEKIVKLCYRYEYTSSNGNSKEQKVQGLYPDYIISAAIKICADSGKFPNKSDIFDEKGYPKPNLPSNLAGYYPCVKTFNDLFFIVRKTTFFEDIGKTQFNQNEINEEDLRSLEASTTEWFRTNHPEMMPSVGNGQSQAGPIH